MGNPFATGSGDRPHLAVLLRFGEGAAAAPGAPEEATVCPLGDLTARDPDVQGPLAPAAGDLRAARAEAVRRWVARRGQIGVEVRLEGNGIRVTGPSSARGLAVADLERLRNAREATRVEVRAYAMDPRTEASILRGLPIQSPGPEAAWRFARLAGDERKRALFLLEGVGGRLALSGEAAAGLSPGQRQGFARTEGTGEALAALEAGVRAWPGEVPGERALWIDLAVKRPADALPVRDSEARVAGARGTAHLFVGLPNPFPGAGERTRLAVWVEAVE
jgi:hypothetical protein